MTTYEASQDVFDRYVEVPPSSRGGFSIFFVLVPLVFAVFSYFMLKNASGLQAVFFPEFQTLSKSEQISEPQAPIISGIFSPSVRYWEQEIISWSNERNLDPNLVATLIQIESCGDPQAESYAGAASLFQVMPFHFNEAEDPFDVQTNAYRGLEYFEKSLLAAEGDIGLAFAGYNGGIGVIDLNPAEWAQQTRDYQYWAENIYADIQNGSNDTLNEWFNAGGASLCQQAENRLAISSIP